MTARKTIEILLFTLLAAYGNAYGAPGTAIGVDSIVNSVSTDAERPGSYALDGDPSTSWGLAENASEGRLEITLSGKSLIYGLVLSARVTSDTRLGFEFRQDGRWVPFAAANLGTYSASGRFIDLSYDRAVTDRIALVLSGADADASSVQDVEVRGVAPETFLHRIQPVEITVSEDASYLEPVESLIDGNPWTAWSGKWSGDRPDDADKVERILKGSSKEHRRDSRRPPDVDAQLELNGEFSLETMRIYMTGSLRSAVTISTRSGGSWTVVGTVRPQQAGWSILDLEGIRADAVEISLPQGNGHPSIGEVELWGKGAYPGAIYEDVGYETTLAAGTPVNYQFTVEKDIPGTLEVAFRGNLAESLSLELNGIEYVVANPRAMEGLTVYRLPLASGAFWSGDNFLRLRPWSTDVEIVSTRFRHEELNGSFDVLSGTPGDEILFTPVTVMQAQNYTFDRSLLLSAVEVYGAAAGTYELKALRHGRWETIAATSVEEDKTVHEAAFLIDRLRLETRGAEIGEIRVLGSPTTDKAPQVRFVQASEDEEWFGVLLANEHGLIIGFVDNPNARVTVNGVRASQAGQYFWVREESLGIRGDVPTTVTATATDIERRTGSATALYATGLDSLAVLDQSDDTLYCISTSCTISGTLKMQSAYVEVNGVAAVMTGKRFSATVPVVEGLNLIRVFVYHRRPDRLIGTLIKKAVCSTGAIRLKLQDPSDGSYLTKATVTLKGLAVGVGIQTVTVGGKEAELSGYRFTSQAITLSEGANTITIRALDRFGRAAELNATLHLDSTKPVVTIGEPVEGGILSTSVVTVRGTATDAGPTWVYVNGRAAGRDGDFYEIELPFSDGQRSVGVFATDAAGNRSDTVSVTFTVDTAAPDSVTVSADPSGWTNDTRPVITFSATDATSGIDHYELSVGGGSYATVTSPHRLPHQEDGTREIRVKAVDRAGWTTTASTAIHIDTVAPQAPLVFRAVPGNGIMVLRWAKPSEDTVSYELSRTPAWDVGSMVLQGEGFEDTAVANGTVYSYSITATDHADNTGEAATAAATVGIAAAPYEASAGAVVEYEEVRLFVEPGSLPEEVREIRVTEVTGEELEEAAAYPILGPIYRFTAVDGSAEELESAVFSEPYRAVISYDPQQAPEGFPEKNLGAYYYDTTWSRWFRISDCVVDEEKHEVLFSTTHFTLFSIQPTAVQEPTVQETMEKGPSPFKTESVHGQVNVSPQGGQASVEVTEFRLPGKAGFDLTIKRVYDGATARADASALAETTGMEDTEIRAIVAAVKSASFNPLQYWKDKTPTVSEETKNAVKSYLLGCGDFGYSMGLGWRLNLPSINMTNTGVTVKLPSGSTHSVGSMSAPTVTYAGDAARTLEFVNHDSGDFILQVSQSRSLNTVTGPDGDVHDEFTSWAMAGATLILKDGIVCVFDAAGQVAEMRDPTGLNVIRYNYQEIGPEDGRKRLLSTITDSMGRIVSFHYDTTYFVPRIDSIETEGIDGLRTVTYTHGDVTADSGKKDIPLLKTATDAEGRIWSYEYQTMMLCSCQTEFSIDVNDSVKAALDGATNGSTDAGVIESLTGTNSRTVSGYQSIQWMFPLMSVHGPGTGNVTIVNETRQTKYVTKEGESSFFGWLPRADISLEFEMRAVVSSVTQADYKNISPSLTTTYGYDFSFGGEGQFYNKTATIDDGLTATTIGYEKTVKTVKAFLGTGEAASAVLAEAGASRSVVPYETSRNVADKAGKTIETTATTWDTTTMRMATKETARADANYEQTEFSYDPWGNVTYRKSYRTTTDGEGVKTESKTETWTHYLGTGSNPWTGWDNTNDYEPATLQRVRKNLALGQKTEASTPTIPGKTVTPSAVRTAYFQYDGKGQKTAEKRFVDGLWNETKYEYDPASSEITKVTSPTLHVTSTTYNYAESGQYIVEVTEESVKDADDSTTNLVRSTGYHKATGFKIWEKNARGYVTAYDYDNLGRIKKTVKPKDGDDPPQVPDVAYSEKRPGNPTSIIDYEDDLLTATVAGFRDQTEVYYYDSLGRLVKVEKKSRPYGDDGHVVTGGAEATLTTSVAYDAWGRIASITNPRNFVTSYEYDAMGRTKKITYPKNADESANPVKELSFEYTTNMQTVTDENGKTTWEYYDLNDKLLRRKQTADGVTIDTRWWYDGFGNLVAEQDGEGRVTLHAYNALGHETTKTLPTETYYEGQEVDYAPTLTTTYDKAGHLTGETIGLSDGKTQGVTYTVDGLGRTIKTERKYNEDSGQGPIEKTATELAFYDGNGNRTKTIDANNSGPDVTNKKTREYSYSSRDKLVKETDEDGKVTEYDYDADDNQILVMDPRESIPGYSGDFTMKQYYDDLGRLILAELPKEAGLDKKPTVHLSYDARGNLETRTEDDGGSTTYTYNARDKVTLEERKEKTSASNPDTISTEHDYDKVGNEKKTIDSRHQETIMDYDSLNRLTLVTYPEGNYESFGYDKAGNRTRETNGNNHATTYTYDSQGRVITATDPKGYTRTLYNGRGDRTYHRDAKGNVNTWTYDERGLLVKETDATGAERKYSYDPAGRLTGSTDPRGTTATIAYTVTNLPETVTRRNGSVTETTTNSYDEAGQLYSTTRGGITLSYNAPSGAYTPNAYGNIHDLSRTVSGTTYTVHYDYDSMNRVTAITSPDGTTVPYLYDTLGRLREMSGYIDGQINYDANGRLEGYRAANGTSVSAAHDDNGRLTVLNYTGTVETLKSFSLGYDGASNVTRKNGSTYAYDELERLVYTRQEGRFAVDPKRVQPDIGLQAEDYGEGGALSFAATELTLKLDYAAMSIGADLGGRYELTKLVIRPTVAGHRISADNLSISTADYNLEDSYEKQTDWSFEEGGNGEMTLLFRQPVTTRYVKLHCFYDDRDADFHAVDASTVENSRAKLLVVYYNATVRTENYTYDAKGNRWTMGLQVGATSLNLSYRYYPNTDRLKVDGEWGYVYDGNGNLTGKGKVFVETSTSLTLSATEGESWSYEYDLENRLTSVRHGTVGTNSLTIVTNYLYDPMGMKIQSSSVKQGQSITILGIDGTLVYEKTTSAERSYVYAFGRHIAKVETLNSTTTKTFYVTDHLGSTVMETDSTGKVVWSTDYSAFGETAHETGLDEEGGKFTGKEKDSETGLYYFNARWYSAETGRFITEDPARDGSNWYVYCNANPLASIDPTGLDAVHLLWGSPGWSHDAPQRIFGYRDWMDSAAQMIFDIHATKFETDMATLRLWKGDYSIGGSGGEIGLYGRDGHSLDKEELKKLGIIDSSIELYSKKDSSLIAGYDENEASYWTTAFNAHDDSKKEDMYSINRIVFNSEEAASDFSDQLLSEVKNAFDYKYNQAETLSIVLKECTVEISWGIPEELE